MLKYFYSTLLFFTVVLLQAQNFAVTGQVLDYHDKSPLEGATVTVDKKSTVTDAEGKFFLKIPKGVYHLTAVHPECAPLEQSISVIQSVHLLLTLEHHEAEIEGVTLHTPHKSAGSMVIKTLSRSEIEKNATENLGNLLTKMSGVGSLNTGANISKPVIHGLYGSRISILNNGVKLAEQEWGVEHAPNVDVNDFAHIDVVKGASALKYGGSTPGGVVLLERENIRPKDTLTGRAGISAISNGKGGSADILLTRSWKNGWAVRAGGSLKKLGDQHAPDYNLMNTGMEFSSFNFTLQNYSFKKGFTLDYALTDQNIGIYRGSHIGSTEDFYHAVNAQIPVYTGDFSYRIDNPRQEVTHHLVKLSAFRRFEDWGKVSAAYSFQLNHRQENDLRRGDLREIPSLDLQLMTHRFTLSDLVEREKFTLETGVEGSFQNNFSDPATKARRLIPDYDEYAAGAFGIFTYRFSPEFTAEGGLRYDFHRYDVTKWYDQRDWENRYADLYPQFYRKNSKGRVLTRPKLNYDNLSVNMGAEYRPSGSFSLKFNYAKAARTPNIAELFSDGLHHSAAIIEVGDLSLQNEISHQFNFLFDVKLNVLDGIRLSLNPYYSYNSNFVTQVPTGVQNTIRGVFPVWSYRQVNTVLFGADVDVDFKINKNFSYQAKGSFVRGEDVSHHEPLILMIAPNFRNVLRFTAQNRRNFYISLENRTTLRQNRFPVYNSTVTFFEGGEEVVKTVDLSTPPAGYSLWNLQAGLDVAKNLSVGLTVNNLFNTTYRDYLNRLRFFSADNGRNVIVTARYKF